MVGFDLSLNFPISIFSGKTAVRFQGEYSFFIENYPLFDTLIHPKLPGRLCWTSCFGGCQGRRFGGCHSGGSDVRNLPTVDGFRNPMQTTTVWMYKTLGNDGINYHSLNWLAGFLNHQQVVVQGFIGKRRGYKIHD